MEATQILPRCSAMDNLPQKMQRKALSAYAICILCLIPVTNGADPNFLDIDCPNANFSSTSTYTANSTFQTNLETVLSSLSLNSNSVNGFYNSTAGSSPPNVVYGLFICRGDFSTDDCQACVNYAVGDVVERCPSSKHVTIWYGPCMLRYSNVSIFSALDTSYKVVLINPYNATNATSFREVLGKVMDGVSILAASAVSGKEKFATSELNYLPDQTLYGLAQCTPDLSESDCSTCLRTGINIFPSCCDAKTGARVLFPSCSVQYESYSFFSTGFVAPPLPTLPAPAPPPSSTNTTALASPSSSTNTTSSHGKGGVSSRIIAAIVVPIGIIVMLFIAGFWCLTRWRSKNHNSVNEYSVDLSEEQSLAYDLAIIQAATNNFSNDNKIGRGGFGIVYKGVLPCGLEVAVKRLSQTSKHGAQQFKNEVVLLAKLQHRNLVRLIGFCLAEEEKLLIYEFVPNKSLDRFLFNPQEQEKLDWSRRYKIIEAVARGMMYLHKDSRLRIIHRDLKASNILLDVNMIAKVADFGLARLFGDDQTHAQTRQRAGTFGYMSPEYLAHGQFSTKSDVFSFGILVLEIISGKRNNFYHSEDAANLLSYAWKLWREGMSLDLLDTTLEGSNENDEVNRCIHIALLCIQDDPTTRPPMATVVLMLNTCSFPLSLPQQPKFLGRREEESINTVRGLQWTVNEASMSEVYPR